MDGRVGVRDVIATVVDDPQNNVAVDGVKGTSTTRARFHQKHLRRSAFPIRFAEVVRVGRSYRIGRANHHTPAAQSRPASSRARARRRYRRAP